MDTNSPQELQCSPNEIEALAAVARCLKEAELRALLELMRRARGQPKVAASTRELADYMGASRPKLQAALQALAVATPTRARLISIEPGHHNQPARYTLEFLRVKSTGGSLREPRNGTQVAPLGSQYVAPFGSQGGSFGEPPSTENQQLTAKTARVDLFDGLPPILDRVLNSKCSNFDKPTIAHFRGWLHGYMAKFGVDDAGRPLEQPHPPDDKALAQFLACGAWAELERLLYALMAERQPVAKYMWFVTTALQRLHGVTWQQTKQARERIKLLKRGQQPEPQPEPPTQQDLLADIGELARKKAMP